LAACWRSLMPGMESGSGTPLITPTRIARTWSAETVHPRSRSGSPRTFPSLTGSPVGFHRPNPFVTGRPALHLVRGTPLERANTRSGADPPPRVVLDGTQTVLCFSALADDPWPTEYCRDPRSWFELQQGQLDSSERLDAYPFPHP
jgi:hypothetical protein